MGVIPTVPTLPGAAVNRLGRPEVPLGWRVQNCTRSPLSFVTAGRDPSVSGDRDTSWKTLLFPKDGGCLAPVKDSVGEVECLEVGDTVPVVL
jgi:hypothetical protein